MATLEQNDFIGLIDLCCSFSQLTKTVSQNKLKNTIELLSDFHAIRSEEEAKLPYHINIVDLLRSDEPAHSKILGSLLRQQSSGKYGVLSSFLELLYSKNNNFEFSISKPQITAEKDRIDVRILDKNYAIIIENKIHCAADQPSQLGRYIEKVKALGYPEKNIYVIYLIRDENKCPDDNSWKSEKNYKESFTPRFHILSYRNDVLPWLEKTILPNCKDDWIAFRGAIEQYVDHLNGLFSLRNIDSNMNKELQEFLKKELDLGDNPNVNHTKILDKLTDIDQLKNQLYSLKDEMELKCWKSWLEQLKQDYPNYRVIDYSESKSFPKVGIILEYKGRKFSVLIEKEQNIYYGFGRHDASSELIPEIKNFLPPIMDMFGVGKETAWWYGLKVTSFENGFYRLKRLIDETIERLV